MKDYIAAAEKHMYEGSSSTAQVYMIAALAQQMYISNLILLFNATGRPDARLVALAEQLLGEADG